MANPEHVEILKQGEEMWNDWRSKHTDIQPDLREAFLEEENLSGADLTDADLRDAALVSAHLIATDLSGADLSGADLTEANLIDANLIDANLIDADLRSANFSRADLSGAHLNGAHLIGTILYGAYLDGADLTGAILGFTSFVTNDLSYVKGLEQVTHGAPSAIGIDTIYKSGGNIPETFLRGCGVPEDFITYMHSLTVQPIQFYSCFISYSHRDEDFARRLYSRMREANLRVWYAPEEMKGGRKLHEQIFNAIHLHDKLLLVLSEHSLKSEWVMTEIRRARKAEREENRRKLFPIKLVDFEAIQKWECFDADSGKDLAVEMREYFIPDFSNWKDLDSFEKAFERLLRDLKAEEKKS